MYINNIDREKNGDSADNVPSLKTNDNGAVTSGGERNDETGGMASQLNNIQLSVIM
jgi:hypothetical protein